VLDVEVEDVTAALVVLVELELDCEDALVELVVLVPLEVELATEDVL
jgi:hypothetical protein